MDPVSRETPPAPPVAQGVFGSRLGLAREYADLLAGEASVRGLIGPREVPRLWARHVLNCAVVADLIPTSASVADVGSGAGLPGLVLAIRRPDLVVTLIEPLLRRTDFLTLAVRELGLDNVEVVRSRAEALAGQRIFDAVASRAVAPLGKLAGWCLPLTRTGGRVLAMKGTSAGDEVTRDQAQVRRAGGGQASVVQLPAPGDANGGEPVRLIVVEKRGQGARA